MKKFLTIATVACFLFTAGMSNADQIGLQNQQQGQAQSATVSGVTAGATGYTGDVGSNNTYEASDLSRGRQFAIPGDVQYGPVINYFGQPLPSEGFQPIEQLLMYSCWFTEGSLESMLKGVESADAEFKVANKNIADAKTAGDIANTRWIKIIISRDKQEGQLKGFITAKSENKDTTMTEVMAKAALTALKNGCNVIHFTAQGAVRDVMSSGWGIGFNTTQAQVYSGDLTKSNVSSGGMGYSSAKAGTRDLPWLQGFGLIDANLVYPPIDEAPVTAPAPAPAQTGNHKPKS
jgi:hypothetical protein